MQVCIKRHMNRNRYSECWIIKKIYYDVVISTNCSIQINCQTIINTLSSMHIKIITLNLYFVVTLNQRWPAQPSTFGGCYWWFQVTFSPHKFLLLLNQWPRQGVELIQVYRPFKPTACKIMSGITLTLANANN